METVGVDKLGRPFKIEVDSKYYPMKISDRNALINNLTLAGVTADTWKDPDGVLVCYINDPPLVLLPHPKNAKSFVVFITSEMMPKSEMKKGLAYGTIEDWDYIKANF